MVPTIYKPGPDVAELLAYITHDGKDRETADRVEWTAGVNLPVDDGPTCGRIMAGNVSDADALKAGAGISTRGRKLKKPYEHITLSWSPEEPRPTREQMMDATHEALAHYSRPSGHDPAQEWVSDIGLRRSRGLSTDRGGMTDARVGQRRPRPAERAHLPRIDRWSRRNGWAIRKRDPARVRRAATLCGVERGRYRTTRRTERTTCSAGPAATSPGSGTRSTPARNRSSCMKHVGRGGQEDAQLRRAQTAARAIAAAHRAGSDSRCPREHSRPSHR